MWAPSPVGPDHLLVVCQMTQPFGTPFPFSRILPTMFLGRGKETSLGDVFISEHLFSLGDLGWVLSGKRDTLADSLSLCHSFHNSLLQNHLSLKRDFCFYDFLPSFPLFPFPFLPSFLP